MKTKNTAVTLSIIAITIIFLLFILKHLILIVLAILVGGGAIYFINKYFGENKSLKETVDLMRELPKKVKKKANKKS